MNKKTINILAISGILLLFIVFLSLGKCLFKIVFNMPCTSCGLTRAFIFILKGDFINAIKMNLLSVPILICVLIFYILYFIYLLSKKDYIFKYYNIFVKHYRIIIVILISNWILNVVKYLYY